MSQHREVTNAPADLKVHHIDGNRTITMVKKPGKTHENKYPKTGASQPAEKKGKVKGKAKGRKN